MLSVDLSQVLVAYTIEFDNASEDAVRGDRSDRFPVSRPFWVNLMRNVTDEGVTVGALRAAAPGSPVTSMLGGLERWGYVHVGEPGSGPPRRPGFGSSRGLLDAVSIRPTPYGRRACDVWAGIDGELARRWNVRFGADAIATLTRELGVLAGSVGARYMPSALPVIGAAHGFETDPACGQSTGDGDESLPALLARLVVAFTLEFEHEAPLSLPLTADVLPVVGETPVAMRALPSLTNVSREAVRMAVGYLQRRKLATIVPNATGKGQAVVLTEKGHVERDKCEQRIVAVERDWTQLGGDDLIAGVDAGLGAIVDAPELRDALEPPPGGWRWRKPYDAQTRAVLADPRTGLPRHPFVLHRGGWPDGS